MLDRSGPFWVMSLAAVMLAGCLGDPGTPEYFDEPFELAAPAWEAGYSWTYKVAESSSYSLTDSKGVDQASDATKVPYDETFTVFNTTKTILGSPAYFAMITKEGGPEESYDDVPHSYNPYSPAGRYEVGVFRKADMAQFGSGWFYLTLTVPSTSSTSGPYSYYDDRYLSNYNVLAVGADEVELPQFQFPLHEGASWNPSTGDDPAPLVYGARVMGLQEIDLDDDVVRAVHVRVVGAIPAELENEYLKEFSAYSKYVESGEADLIFTGDYWWGINEFNLVKSVELLEVDYHLEGRRPSGQDYEASGHAAKTVERILVGHSLRAWDQEQRVPVYKLNGKNDPALDAALNAAISYNGGGNLDVGAGPASVEFYLSSDHGYYCAGDYESWASCPGEPLDLDEERFSVSWTLQHSGPLKWTEQGTGMEFDHSFFQPGVYVARAEIYDEEYDAIVRTADAYVSVGWTQEVLREEGPGVAMVEAPEAAVLVMQVPVPQPGAFLQLSFDVRPDTFGAVRADHGTFYYLSPDGSRSAGFPDQGSVAFYADEVGTYLLFWERDRPVWTGDDPWARAQVSYNFHDYVGL